MRQGFWNGFCSGQQCNIINYSSTFCYLQDSSGFFLNDRNVIAILSGALGQQWRASSHTLGKVIQGEQHPLLEARAAVAEMVAGGGIHQRGGENLITEFPSMREKPSQRASGYIKGN